MKQLIFLLTGLTTLLHAQSSMPPATYVGYVAMAEASYFIEIAHQADSTLISMPDAWGTATVLGQWQNNELSVSHQFAEWHFQQLHQTPHGIQATVSRAGLAGNLYAFPVEEQWVFDAKEYTHSYRLPHGEYISVWAQGDRLRMHAAPSGKVTRLYPLGADRFFSTAGERISFSQDKQSGLRQMIYEYLDAPAIVGLEAPDFSVQRQEVMILNDTVGLSLYIPAGDSLHPACIIPMGAARYERWIYDLEARLLASHGIATLIYDNYGMGQSGGTFPDKTFVDKKNQLLALYDWLARQEGIATDQIGFRGGSQGGRLALMAAAEQPRTAFVIALSAPLETRLDQQLYAFSAHHRQLGYPEGAISRNTELWRRYFAAVLRQQTANELLDEITQLRKSYPEMILPGLALNQVPELPWAADLTDSTMDYLHQITCPILALYGAHDDRVPSTKSASLLNQSLQAARKDPATVIIYEGANHSFLLPGQRIVPGLFMDQIRFVRQLIAKASTKK